MTSAVVFAYSEVGVRCLRVLVRHGVHVPLVLTHEDDPDERRWFGSVADEARQLQLQTAMPADPNSDAWVETIAQLKPDFLFSFYYRQLLSDRLLSAPRSGALNMHGSLLPRYRGRASIHWAIIRGETETGASLHYMSSRPDAGPLVAQERVPILINDTALDISLKVASAAERLLERCLPDLLSGRARATPLDLNLGSYFGRRRPEDGRISWKWPAIEIHNLIRGTAPPFPGAFGVVGGRVVRLLGSRYQQEPARHAEAAPCLYANEGVLYLDCVDGCRIELTSVEFDGSPLTPVSFTEQYGPGPLSLDPARDGEASAGGRGG